MSKSKILGIDLGTTNSCVAIVEGGVAKVIENYEGKRVTASVIAFSDDGKKFVGGAAKRQAHSNAQKTLYAVKRLMGKKFNEVQDLISKLSYTVVPGPNGEALIKINDKEYDPSYISSLLLRQLVDDASTYLGQEITDVVITVPAHFDDAQRQATTNAGKIAGLNVLRIINEPTAAAIAYGVEKLKSGRILVFDLGGGTFDVTLLEVEEGLFKVLSTDGDTDLGGEDFDNEIMNIAIQDFKNKEGIDLSKNKVALYRIKEAAEEAKKELSISNQATISVPFITEGPKNLYCEITRGMFESKINHLVTKAIKLTLKTIESAGITMDEIDRVVCVGGSTRVPLVREQLQKLINKKISVDINPDEAVAVGASLQGGVLSGDIADIVLLDVTPLSLGIESLGGVFTKIIEKNSSIPISKSRIFTTASDSQTSAQISIFQGERGLVKDNKKLGSFELLGIKNAPRGEPQIEVTFHIDANGILQASAKDLGTGSEQKIVLSPETGLSKEDIEKMCKEAEEQRLIDDAELKRIELKNNYETGIHSVERLINENKERLGEASDEYLAKLAEIKVMSDMEVAVEQIQQLMQQIQSKLAGP